jgi:hypothetical protein
MEINGIIIMVQRETYDDRGNTLWADIDLFNPTEEGNKTKSGVDFDKAYKQNVAEWIRDTEGTGTYRIYTLRGEIYQVTIVQVMVPRINEIIKRINM